jgi:hypothetical protein
VRWGRRCGGEERESRAQPRGKGLPELEQLAGAGEELTERESESERERGRKRVCGGEEEDRCADMRWAKRVDEVCACIGLKRQKQADP